MKICNIDTSLKEPSFVFNQDELLISIIHYGKRNIIIYELTIKFTHVL